MRRILVVDDDQDTLANISDILEDAGYETVVAETAEEALHYAQQAQGRRCVDLCLLDYKMPGMDGAELLTQLRRKWPDLRAIMITAYADDDGLRRAHAAGTWQVLQKPVDMGGLLSSISQAIAG